MNVKIPFVIWSFVVMVLMCSVYIDANVISRTDETIDVKVAPLVTVQCSPNDVQQTMRIHLPLLRIFRDLYRFSIGRSIFGFYVRGLQILGYVPPELESTVYQSFHQSSNEEGNKEPLMDDLKYEARSNDFEFEASNFSWVAKFDTDFEEYIELKLICNENKNENELSHELHFPKDTPKEIAAPFLAYFIGTMKMSEHLHKNQSEFIGGMVRNISTNTFSKIILFLMSILEGLVKMLPTIGN